MIEIAAAVILGAFACTIAYANGVRNGRHQSDKESRAARYSEFTAIAKQHQELMFWQNPKRYILEKSRLSTEDMLEVEKRVWPDLEGLDEFDLLDYVEMKGWLSDRAIN
jgi:hypothetical protein